MTAPEVREVIVERPVVVDRTRTETEIVRVPTEREGEAYREAMRREARVSSPAVAGHLERVEQTARQILHGETVKPKWKLGWED